MSQTRVSRCRRVARTVHARLFPIFDILERLWRAGYTTVEQDGRWWLFAATGEGIMSGSTFRDLCVNIVLAGIDA